MNGLSDNNIRSKRNGKVDLLRFLFALFIMFLHYGYRPELVIEGVTFRLGQNGAFAVVFFFILSGYLLAKSVHDMPNYQDGMLANDELVFLKKKFFLCQCL